MDLYSRAGIKDQTRLITTHTMCILVNFDKMKVYFNLGSH